MKYRLTRHRKNLTKLQKTLYDMAEGYIAKGVKIEDIHSGLHDYVRDWKIQNPNRKEQTYVTAFWKNEYDPKSSVCVRDAGADATIVSIREEE